MQKAILILSFLFSATVLYAQTGIIAGSVYTSDSEPAPFVNVLLEGTGKGAATDAQGCYTIRHLKEGIYTLVVSYVGFETHKQEVSVIAGETVQVPAIRLEISSANLEEVVVAARDERFTIAESDYVAKMPLKRMENPQVYNTISNQLLREQVVTSFDEAMKNAPGLYKLWESTGRGGDGAAYYSLRGFPVQPRLLNGLPALTNGSRDPINVERIEVLKGPSGTLFGSSVVSYGGLINVVTKKPYETFGGEVSYTTGSFGLSRITADINTPVDEEGNVLFRMNSAYHYQGSFQDAGFQRSLFIAPSLSYQVNKKLSFRVNTEFYQPESTNPTMLFLNRSAMVEVNDIKALGYDYRNSHTSNDLTVKTPTYTFQGQMNYRFSDQWSSQTVLARTTAVSDGYYTYLYAASGAADLFRRYVSKQNVTNTSTNLQQNFIGEFDLGAVRNKLVVGLDYLETRAVSNSTGYVGLGLVNLSDSVYDSGILSRPGADAALATLPVVQSVTEQSFYGAYFSDVINLTPQLSVMISARLDHFANQGNMENEEDNFTQTAVSPKLGVVYQPIPNRLSLFANYMNGFSNVAPRIQEDGRTRTFEPEQANQLEGGVKANMFDGKLVATFSYYDITVSNTVMQDPDRVNYYLQGGEAYRRGFEADIVANPLPGLNLIAGYSHIEAEITRTDNEAYLNRRPEEAGPKNLVNAWISYRLPAGLLKGIGAGFGGNYIGENNILNRANTGTFTLPAYTILNASAYYEAPAFRAALKVNNLTDTAWYSGWSTINPQLPRNLLASLTYKF